MPVDLPWAARVLVAVIVGLFFCAVIGEVYEKYLRLTRWTFTLAVFAMGIGLVMAFHQPMAIRMGLTPLYRWVEREPAESLFETHRGPFIGGFLPIAIFPLFVVPFVAKLYRAWRGGVLTDAEKLAGSPGFRAWLSVGNLVCAAGISLCAWMGYGYSFWGVLALAAAAVLAYPIWNTYLKEPAVVQPPPASPPRYASDLSAERERVLRLLETGKITAEESAELLSALGESVPPGPSPAAVVEMTPARRWALFGAVLVTVGFFMPWFTIDLGLEMQQMRTQLNNVELNADQVWTQEVPAAAPHGAASAGTVSVTGGDIDRGMGWLVLLLAIGATAIPYVATGMTPHAQRSVASAALGGGSLVLIYLLTKGVHWINFGIVAAGVGYTMLWFSIAQEQRLVRRSSSSAV